AGLAVLSAVYTAFLFAQAKGRDFWQNPLLCVHLLAHALLAAGALWLVFDPGLRGRANGHSFMIFAVSFSLLTLLAEIFTTPPTKDARLALDWIIGRPRGAWLWLAGIGVG